MSDMWTRRQILALSGSALLATVLPVLPAKAFAARKGGLVLGDASVATGETNADALYRKAFVLDCNTLASIGTLAGDKDIGKELQAIRDSGLTALKSTLGGASGTFEETVADIAAAQALIERYPDMFVKVVGHDDLETGGQGVVRRVCGRGEVASAGHPVGGRDVAGRVTHQHDVAATVGAGLEQDRVHRRLGCDPRGQGLHPLRPADLGGRAAGGDAHHRVVRHVLCLEGRDLHPATGERATQPRRDDRLSGVRGRAGDQQAAHGRLSR